MTISVISICITTVLVALIINIKEYITDKERRKEEMSAEEWKQECNALRNVYDRIDNLLRQSSFVVVTKEQRERICELFHEADKI